MTINYRTKEQQCLILLTVPPEAHRNHRATQDIKTTTAMWPAMPSWVLTSRNLLLGHRNVCTFMLFVALVTRHGTKTSCPSRDKWINKINIHTNMESYSVTKKNKIVSLGRKWIEPKNH